MKKLFKVIKLVLLVLVGVLLFGYLFINFSKIPSYEIVPIKYKAVSSPEAIERGRKLALMLCANCHMNLETRKLTGMRLLEAPPEFGEIYSANITQDKQYGIGNYTDAELIYLFRTGIKKDGQYAPPYMAKMPHMADEDLNAIISFLRSDDNMVQGDPTPDTPSKPSFLTKLLCRIVWKPFSYPTEIIKMPDTTNTIELGAYLANNLECFSCHSADFKTNNYLEPGKSKGYFGGGNKPLDREGRLKLTPNLTPDKETGIGNWTEEQFIRAVKSGIVDNQPALGYPMVPYTQFTDKEVGAIYKYLQSIPPIKNKVDRSIYN